MIFFLITHCIQIYGIILPESLIQEADIDNCVQQRRLLAQEFKAVRNSFLALGDENRQQVFLAILESEQIGIRVGEIVRQTHLSRPAVSHHLRILRNANLICMHRQRTMNYYYINGDAELWRQFKQLMDHICADV